MNLRKSFREFYKDSIQLSPFQAQTIASAILSRQPGCSLLVFGLGNDSPLWLDLNRDGETLFMETSEEWISIVQRDIPDLSCAKMPTLGLTVETSMSLNNTDLLQYSVPEQLQRKWDVILVDAPPGYGPQDPGRAIAISWAARLANDATHVLVDDYERPLEERFANMCIRDVRPNASSVIQASRNNPNRKLFWSIGSPML